MSFCDVTVSPDGKYIASTSLDAVVRVWNVTARRSTKLIGHAGSVTSVSYSPDGTYIASASRDRTIRLWKVDPRSPGQAKLHRVIGTPHLLNVCGTDFDQAQMDETFHQLVSWDQKSIQQQANKFPDSNTKSCTVA